MSYSSYSLCASAGGLRVRQRTTPGTRDIRSFVCPRLSATLNRKPYPLLPRDGRCELLPPPLRDRKPETLNRKPYFGSAMMLKTNAKIAQVSTMPSTIR